MISGRYSREKEQRAHLNKLPCQSASAAIANKAVMVPNLIKRFGMRLIEWNGLVAAPARFRLGKGSSKQIEDAKDKQVNHTFTQVGCTIRPSSNTRWDPAMDCPHSAHLNMFEAQF